MKIVVICSEYQSSNFALQPWRYISEIVKALASFNHDVQVITNTNEPAMLNVHKTNDVRLNWKNNTLERKIDSLQPDVCLWNLGLTSSISFIPKKLKWPSYAVFTSPIYSLPQLLQLGPKRLWQTKNYIIIHLLGSILPKSQIKKMISPFQGVISLSEYNAQKLLMAGVPEDKIHHIPPGVDEEFRQIQPLPKAPFTITYMGSPLPIRGVFDLIKAVNLAKGKIPNIQLRILSRNRGNYHKYENRLRYLIEVNKLDENVTIRSGFLSKKELLNELGQAHLIALPFLITPSDVPLAILENMAQGRSILSTKVASITEYLREERGYLATPGNIKELSNQIIQAANNQHENQQIANNALEYSSHFPSWEEVGIKVNTLLTSGISL